MNMVILKKYVSIYVQWKELSSQLSGLVNKRERLYAIIP